MKRTPVLARSHIIGSLKQSLQPKNHILAMWEGGAAAFGRVDRWSDIDLMVAAKEGQTEKAASDIERILRRLSPVAAQLSVKHPNWPDMIHTFYKLRHANEFLLVDVGVMPRNCPDKLLETEIHGQAVVHFDKANLCQPPKLDREKFLSDMKQRKLRIIAMFEMISNFAIKELNRKNFIEAQYNYFMILDMLVETLRMKHGPYHYNFRGRYLHYELPVRTVRKLQALFYVKDPTDLRRKEAAVRRWFKEIIAAR
jgi:predicted nucleotidyltransferase